jgi:hypothetical protein
MGIRVHFPLPGPFSVSVGVFPRNGLLSRATGAVLRAGVAAVESRPVEPRRVKLPREQYAPEYWAERLAEHDERHGGPESPARYSNRR